MRHPFLYSIAVAVLGSAIGTAQPPMANQPAFVREGQQLQRQGKLTEALEIYTNQLKTDPASMPALNAAGSVLDLMGKGDEARKYFAKAIEAAPTPQAKAQAKRAMAMSWAFENNCDKTAEYEKQVFAYYVETKDFYQQGEMANEAARVCIEAGDLDTAYTFYKTGTEVGLKEPDIKPERVALWNFRWEHAQARIAARRGHKAEASKHVAAAQALLDGSPEMAKQQAIFFPYLTGYVAFHGGDYKTAVSDLSKANQNDPFIQVLMAQAHEKLGDKDKAMELYGKAAATTAHNPPAAYARPFATRKLAGR